MIARAGGQADAGAVDITDETSVNDAIVEAASKHSRLDGLVCTPAINVRKPILKYTRRRIRSRGAGQPARQLQRAAVGRLADGAAGIRQHRAVLVDPIDRHRAGQSVYSMTKAGILQLVKTAATEWGTTGVRVNAVGPGVIETPLTAPIKQNPEWYNAYAMKNPMNRWAQAAGDGRADDISLVGRRQLCHRHDPVCRWRLAGRGWTVHAAGDVEGTGASGAGNGNARRRSADETRMRCHCRQSSSPAC